MLSMLCRGSSCFIVIPLVLWHLSPGGGRVPPGVAASRPPDEERVPPGA